MLPGLVSAIVGGAGRGQIQFVGAATDNKATTSSSTIALNSGLTGGIASSVAAGDLVIAAFGCASTSDLTLSITDGATGYTLIGSELYSADTDDANLRVAYKFMGVSPDASTTFGGTGSSSNGASMVVYVFRGVDPGTPLDVSAVTATGQNSLLTNPPSITPSTPGAFVVAVGAWSVSVVTPDPATHPTLLSVFSDIAPESSTYQGGVAIGHTPWVSGAVDPGNFVPGDTDSTNSAWCAMSIALRPA